MKLSAFLFTLLLLSTVHTSTASPPYEPALQEELEKGKWWLVNSEVKNRNLRYLVGEGILVSSSSPKTAAVPKASPAPKLIPLPKPKPPPPTKKAAPANRWDPLLAEA